MERHMSRSAILASQFSDSQVATALHEHREDRDALLASLTASLEADPRVRALWLWGSFERGEADDLSDLDPWIIVTDEAALEIGPSLRHYAQQTGNFIVGGEAPHLAPPQGGFFASRHEGRHGLLHVDCYWQAQSAIETVTDFYRKSPTADRVYLIDRLDAPPASSHPFPIPPDQSVPLTQRETEIEGGIGFAWLMFSIAAKYLARYPDSDMALMQYPRPGLENAAVLLGKERLLTASDWSVPEKSIDKLHSLRRLASKASELTEAANKQGMPLSPLHAVCLGRYLDMVGDILIAKP